VALPAFWSSDLGSARPNILRTLFGIREVTPKRFGVARTGHAPRQLLPVQNRADPLFPSRDPPTPPMTRGSM
jgi:hypothetical protein